MFYTKVSRLRTRNNLFDGNLFLTRWNCIRDLSQTLLVQSLSMKLISAVDVIAASEPKVEHLHAFVSSSSIMTLVPIECFAPDVKESKFFKVRTRWADLFYK